MPVRDEACYAHNPVISALADPDLGLLTASTGWNDASTPLRLCGADVRTAIFAVPRGFMLNGLAGM